MQCNQEPDTLVAAKVDWFFGFAPFLATSSDSRTELAAKRQEAFGFHAKTITVSFEPVSKLLQPTFLGSIATDITMGLCNRS